MAGWTGRNGAHTSAGVARKRIGTAASGGYGTNYAKDTNCGETYQDRVGCWEEDDKDFTAWGYKDYNGYHENSKDFAAWGYDNHYNYHQDINNRAKQDKERCWPGTDPLAYLPKEDLCGPPESAPPPCSAYRQPTPCRRGTFVILALMVQRL